VVRDICEKPQIMSSKIFPFEWTHPSSEQLNAQINRQSSIIFLVILLMITIAFAALPIIKVEVGVEARGAIRDIQNNVVIGSLIQGQVLYHHLAEDRVVSKGEKLLVLNAAVLETEREKINQEIQTNIEMEQDLNTLLQSKTSLLTLRSGLYQQAYNQYTRELNTLEIKKQYTQSVLQRTSKLYKQEVVAKMEFEKAQFDADLANSELQLLQEQQRKTWEIETQRIRQQLLELRTKLNLLQNQAQNYTINAPCSGTLVQANGIEAGSYVMPGQQLAFISTQDSLLAEVYIPAYHIGYIRKNTRVRILLDAYNFHEWGTINGQVKEVSSEIKIVNKTPVLLAQVSLDRKVLKLKNGYVGKLKKGMTLSAHFILQKRSLFALLYDKAEDWLDPRKTSTK
jgi:HlyD family secretion protein